MKNTIKVIIASTMLTLVAASAMADLNSGRVERPNVYHHMKTVISQVPYNVEVCKQVYTNGTGASSADVLFGAIIGGVIGNQVGKGKGNDAATILGAIIGADVANKNKPTTNGQTQTICTVQTRYEESRQEVYSHSTISWMIDNVKYYANYTHEF